MDSFETLGSSSKLKEESDDINNMMAELYREAGTTLLKEPDSSMVFMDLQREDEDHIRKIKVKRMVKPGCSQEVLKVALNSMSSLVSILLPTCPLQSTIPHYEQELTRMPRSCCAPRKNLPAFPLDENACCRFSCLYLCVKLYVPPFVVTYLVD